MVPDSSSSVDKWKRGELSSMMWVSVLHRLMIGQTLRTCSTVNDIGCVSGNESVQLSCSIVPVAARGSLGVQSCD